MKLAWDARRDITYIVLCRLDLATEKKGSFIGFNFGPYSKNSK